MPSRCKIFVCWNKVKRTHFIVCEALNCTDSSGLELFSIPHSPLPSLSSPLSNLLAKVFPFPVHSSCLNLSVQPFFRNMVFEFSRKTLWQKVEQLHPSPSPQDPEKCREQLGEAFYLILEIQKENIAPDVVVKIDSFISLSAKVFKRWVHLMCIR